jgi:hypothetical protein
MTTYDIGLEDMPDLKNRGLLEGQEFICVSARFMGYRPGDKYRVLNNRLERYVGTGWIYTGYNGRSATWKRVVEKDLDDYL